MIRLLGLRITTKAELTKQFSYLRIGANPMSKMNRHWISKPRKKVKNKTDWERGWQAAMSLSRSLFMRHAAYFGSWINRRDK